MTHAVPATPKPTVQEIVRARSPKEPPMMINAQGAPQSSHAVARELSRSLGCLLGLSTQGPKRRIARNFRKLEIQSYCLRGRFAALPRVNTRRTGIPLTRDFEFCHRGRAP